MTGAYPKDNPMSNERRFPASDKTFLFAPPKGHNRCALLWPISRLFIAGHCDAFERTHRKSSHSVGNNGSTGILYSLFSLVNDAYAHKLWLARMHLRTSFDVNEFVWSADFKAIFGPVFRMG